MSLVVVVAQDKASRALKGRATRFPSRGAYEGRRRVRSSRAVVPGDESSGSWHILKSHSPDLVILGYDQNAIADELEKRSIAYMYISPHEA